MRLMLAILLVASAASAADTARCVKWERVPVTEYEWNGKAYKSKTRYERRNAYLVAGQRVEVVSDDTDAAEKSAVEAKTGKTVTLAKGKVKP